MNTPALEKHHGAEVWSNRQMDKLRKTECLCLNCNHMTLCDTARTLHKLCVERNIAFCMTRCPEWGEESEAL